MSKGGWFGNKQAGKLDVSEREDRKELNIWNQQKEIDIPEIEDVEESQAAQAEEDDMFAPIAPNIPYLIDLRKKVNPNTLIDDTIDLSCLTNILAPFADVNETNELWEFQTLKNEISSMVFNNFN